ncbi:MAG: hypothetical protein JNM93_04750 [Bacteriovoracaceae bacterium]|nr:hypothetical protein [Bacteriovoracaceae bacterium]
MKLSIALLILSLTACVPKTEESQGLIDNFNPTEAENVELNHYPQVNNVSDISLTENESKTVQVQATDLDGDSLVVAFAQSLPSFITLVDKGNGLAELQINPSTGDDGQYNLKLVVTDAKGAKGYSNSIINIAKFIQPIPDEYTNVECKLRADGGLCDYFFFNVSENLYQNDTTARVLKNKDYPGKTVCVEANRTYTHLGFTNVKGEPGNPVTIINCGGQVKSEKANASGDSALNVFSSRYIRITGTGSKQHQYGFYIKGGTHSVNISKGASDYEIDHLEIAGFGYNGGVYGGLMAKTYPDIYNDCNLAYAKGNFTQWNTILHDNYIHDVSGEAVYVGTSHYQKSPSPTASGCATAEQKAMAEAPLRMVRIYNNRIENVGRDGIQLGGAIEDSEIHHNTVKNFALTQSYGHTYGIILNPGTIGKVYNNRVEANPSSALSSSLGYHGGDTGDIEVYNNIFLNSSTGMETGGHMNNPNYKFLLSNNTFVIKNTGVTMRFHCPAASIAYFEIKNNIYSGFKTYVDQPTVGGVFQLIRANTSKCRMNGIQYGNETDETKLAIPGNFYHKDNSVVQYENITQGDYHLKYSSPANIHGVDYSSIYQNDLEENPRIYFTYGAFE